MHGRALLTNSFMRLTCAGENECNETKGKRRELVCMCVVKEIPHPFIFITTLVWGGDRLAESNTPVFINPIHRTKMDPLNNCVHMACTEIRAENLSGECHWFREAVSGRIKNFSKHGQECVKRRAALSVKANPNCSDKADEYVDAAFERCFEDTFPFDRHPNLR